ncbi:cytidine deaminase [Agarivorans sp. OAG1]|uniref:cytidine deaminase family protein n=1 Tax=Agarivorans sp. OAG1 TaxID=3082387 RepID=UPI002B318FE4|nr:cytidine deaminase [Agarivorans sp. OAG1]
MFRELVSLAQSKLRAQEFSGKISCGQVSAAIETSSGKQFSGVCIDAPCSLGTCAERNAIGSMITEGEFKIIRLICIKGNDVILPCGACQELLLQLHPENSEIEVLTSIDGETIKLRDLMPYWWGNIY